MKEFIERRRFSSEGGGTAVFCIGMLGLFLTLSAFAIDIGALYLGRIRVDKAARAASLAAMGVRSQYGFTETNTTSGRTELNTKAESTARYNLQAIGADISKLKVATNYQDGKTTGNESITVQLSYEQNTYLVGRLSGIFGFALSNGSRSIPITSSQTASLNPAYVTIVIDVSGSMLCPANEVATASLDTCQCRRLGTCDVSHGTSKLEHMIEGVKTFAKSFNPNTDYISIIPFNLGAWTAFSMFDSSRALTTFGARRADFDQVLNAIASYVGGNTNHCDALAETVNEFNNLAKSPKMSGRSPELIRPYVLFFTDGAPNAFRGIFDSGSLNNSALKPTQSDFNTYKNVDKFDLYHYAIEWYNSGSKQSGGKELAPEDPLRTYRGPSPFVVRDTVDGKPNVWKLEITNATIVPLTNPHDPTSPRYPYCGAETSAPDKFIETIDGNNSKPGCLKNSPAPGATLPGTFTFAVPYTGTSLRTGDSRSPAMVRNVPFETSDSVIDNSWPTGTPNSRVQLYDQLPYYCAIEAADYIRSTFGGTIFTIGLGPGPLATDNSSFEAAANCSDPLQDANDHLSRKDSFLTRLSYTNLVSGQGVPVWYLFRRDPRAPAKVSSCTDHRYQSSITPKLPITVGYSNGGTPEPDETTGLDLGLRPIKSRDPYQRRINTEGKYYPTNDATQLPALFGSVAKSILLRLTS